MIRITIPGNPVPLQRPRHTRTGITYNPQSEEMARTALYIKSLAPDETFMGPVGVNMTFFMYIPRSLSKKKQKELDGTFCTAKFDIDNLAKKSLDELTRSGSIFKDDSQVCSLKAIKKYDFNPRTEIEIYSL